MAISADTIRLLRETDPLLDKLSRVANEFDCDVRLTGDERDRIMSMITALPSLIDSAASAERARDEGRREGIEKAAKIAEHAVWFSAHDQSENGNRTVAAAIRNLTGEMR